MKARTNPGIIIAHICFWLLLSATPLQFNTFMFGLPTAIVRTFIPMGFIMFLAYLNIFVIIPRLFHRKEFRWYLPFLAYAVILPLSLLGLENIFYILNEWTDIRVSLTFQAWENGVLVNYNKSETSFPRSVVGLMVLFTLFVSSLYGLGNIFIQRDRQAIHLKSINLKNELKLLRSQINPHFLFNALNNLYAIVQLQPQKAGEFVMKLSDMLRYVTYDCQQDKVSLQKEIGYINNYIYFQKWRDQRFNDIQFEVAPQLSDWQIEPMLLIPFIENAFKHSYDQQTEGNRWVKIALHKEAQQLLFQVSNSRSSHHTKEEVPDEYMGIGIENVQKRLELLYEDRYALDIDQQEDHFSIKLRINL